MLVAVVVVTTSAPEPAVAEWPPFGRAVSTAPTPQSQVAIDTDGAGGAIIAWQDTLNPRASLFVQHVLATGERDPSWPAEGVALLRDPSALANALAGQELPVIVPDGAGGAIVAWQDGRNTVADPNPDVFAQHVLASGVTDPAWPANGVALCAIAGAQVFLSAVTDGAGGAIVTWMDGRPGASIVDVYAQRVLASGAVDARWPANGLAVSVAIGPQEFPVLVADGQGGAIIAWYDLRFGPTGFDIYAQHILDPGVVDPAWPVNGLAICMNVSDQFNPTIVSDGSGGAIVAWDDNRDASFHPFAQHVLVSGRVDPAWPVDGVAISNGALFEEFPRLASDGAGGAIVTWQSRRTHINQYAQHLMADGRVDPTWPVNGMALGDPDTDQIRASIGTDGAGGALVAWEQGADIVAQHVLASGELNPAYPADGRAVCDLPSRQAQPLLVSTGAGGAIVAWLDGRDDSDADIYALQVQAAGTLDVPAPTPAAAAFALPSPNPAREALTLRFTLARDARVRLAIFDPSGRRVRDLASGERSAGEHAVRWDLRDGDGRAVDAGLYFARLEAGGVVETRRLVTLR